MGYLRRRIDKEEEFLMERVDFSIETKFLTKKMNSGKTNYAAYDSHHLRTHIQFGIDNGELFNC